MHWRSFVIAVIAVLTIHVSRAPADSRAAAKQHVERATKLHAEGKFTQALDELKTAFSLDPRPDLLYAMGQIHVSLGQCLQAITYYQRYLATKPNPDTANVANEAIDACKTNPPTVTAALAPASMPSPQDGSASLPPRPEEEITAQRAWYSDYLADAMVAGGVTAGLAGLFAYRSAVQNRDRADTATGFQRYVDLVDRAHDQRALALALGVAGAALVAAGGLHYALTDRARSTISISPSQGGGS